MSRDFFVFFLRTNILKPWGYLELLIFKITSLQIPLQIVNVLAVKEGRYCRGLYAVYTNAKRAKVREVLVASEGGYVGRPDGTERPILI